MWLPDDYQRKADHPAFPRCDWQVVLMLPRIWWGRVYVLSLVKSWGQ